MLENKKKSKSNQMTLETKKTIINKYRNSKISQRKLAEDYNSSVGCINLIIKRGNDILAVNEAVHKRKPNLYKTKAIDNILYEWFQQKRQRNFTITDDIMKSKAIEFSKELNITNFNASSGWLQSFKRRHEIKSFKLSGESDFIDNSLVSNFHVSIKNKIEQYDQSNIFNCDELALFYRGLPEKTLSFMKSNLNSKINSKVRVSILLCCSSTGEKLSPLIIGKFKSPRCLKNIDVKSLGLDYRNNKSAWMTSSLFKDWLIELNRKLCLNNRRILIFLDNAPVHPRDILISNIELIFLPPKTTGLTQPLDAGVIRSFKCKYRRLLNEKLIFESGNDENISNAINRLTLLDSLILIKKSWDSITIGTIRNCFKKTNILKEEVEEIDLFDNDDEPSTSESNLDPFVDEENFTNDYNIENDKDLRNIIQDQNKNDEDDNENDIVDNTLYDVSYSEAISSLKYLEMWFIQNCPDKLGYVDAIKDQMIVAKRKTKATILDFFPRKSCKFN